MDRVLCQTLVGRGDELFRLEDALLAAHRGEGRLIALGGEAGMGKTATSPAVLAGSNLPLTVAPSECRPALDCVGAPGCRRVTARSQRVRAALSHDRSSGCRAILV
jgi:hypothetical protein